MTASAAERFNSAFDRWNHTILSPQRVSDLEFEELIHLVTPWMTEARELVGDLGLQNLANEGLRLRGVLNTTLDTCESWCKTHAASLGEILICLEGVEDLLVGLEITAH